MIEIHRSVSLTKKFCFPNNHREKKSNTRQNGKPLKSLIRTYIFTTIFFVRSCWFDCIFFRLLYFVRCVNVVGSGLVMSQSQVRKPQSIGGEKGRFSMVKASGDSAPCAPHQSQPKQHQSNRSKNNIPKSIRYDLENALVGVS